MSVDQCPLQCKSMGPCSDVPFVGHTSQFTRSKTQTRAWQRHRNACIRQPASVCLVSAAIDASPSSGLLQRVHYRRAWGVRKGQVSTRCRGTHGDTHRETQLASREADTRTHLMPVRARAFCCSHSTASRAEANCGKQAEGDCNGPAEVVMGCGQTDSLATSD